MDKYDDTKVALVFDACNYHVGSGASDLGCDNMHNLVRQNTIGLGEA